MEKKKPVDSFRLGRIKTAIWSNTAKDGKEWFIAEIKRSYLEGDEWKDDIIRLTRDDLLRFAFACNEARSRMLKLEECMPTESDE